MEQIATDTMVEMKFRMRTHLPDGSIKERPEETLAFIFGVERQPVALEKAMEGARAGEKMAVHIPPSQIYGEHDPALLHEIPKEGLIRQRIKKGRFYRQMKKGTLVSFKILEVRSDTVLADFNKPMAGISASVDLEVLSVRKARREEIAAAVESQAKRSIGCG
ncbi:MAG: FKBP-type peptidyl-prolyl cis-trans isomerase [Desulfatiglandaceae bacterium]|jgi:FKBP-type peptidyl-prolyl cis-trans isomerase SlyD